MIDYRGRDDVSITIERSRNFEYSTESTFDDEFLADFPEAVELSVPISPLDVFLVIFSCCHLMLCQTLLHIGKLAVPILYIGWRAFSAFCVGHKYHDIQQ